MDGKGYFGRVNFVVSDGEGNLRCIEWEGKSSLYGMGRVIFGISNGNRWVADPSGSPSDCEEGANGGPVFGDGESGLPTLPPRNELEGDEPL